MKMGLVLSGGGVKGAAHIGALKALEEDKIEISAISGTSSGSIVAALYSCGYKPDEIYYIFRKYCRYITDYDKMLPFKLLNTLFTGKVKVKSLAKGDNIECIMNSFCNKKGKNNMMNMDIPCVIPAVDIIDGRIIYFCSRKNKLKFIERDIKNTTEFIDKPDYIYDAKISSVVRASTAFPGVFEPKRIGSHILVDGGVRVNSPVTALKNITDYNEKILVIYFEKSNNNQNPQNIIDTTVKSFDIMSHEVNELEIRKADFKLDIESRNIGLLDISKVNYMVNLGYFVTKNYIKKLKANDAIIA